MKLKQTEEISDGGIVLHTKTTKAYEQNAVRKAYVEAIGPVAFKDYGDGKPWCKVGDMILMGRYAGTHNLEDAETDSIYRVIEDSDVLAVIEEDTIND